MSIDIFELERRQSLWENRVKYNLSESGVHPYSIQSLMDKEEQEHILKLELGYGQTNGSIELRTAISRLYTGATLDNILVTNGSAEANFIAIWSLLKSGDELILILPNYMQIWGLARSFGVKIKPLYLQEALNWQPDINELQQLINSKTRMIAICNPNNPTGAILPEQTMIEIVDVAEKANIWIYADEVYRGAELNNVETISFWNLRNYNKILVCCGLSKAYALPGLRIGWLVGSLETIENCWAYHDYTTIAPGILSDRIATYALQPEVRMKILARNRAMLRQNLAILTQWLDTYGDLFQFIPPKAAGLAFIKYNLNINSTELTVRLRDEKSLLIIAGDCFGMDHYIRIGIGSEKDYLIAGLKLLSEFLEEIQNSGI